MARQLNTGWIFVLLMVSFTQAAFSQEKPTQKYPDMVGVWKAQLRTMSSGAEVASGGIMIREVEAVVTVEHQDGEVFMGKVRLSNMTASDRSVKLWGTIRSNGEEALFIGDDGTRGPIWFIDDTSYEFCVASLSENAMTGYCGIFHKAE